MGSRTVLMFEVLEARPEPGRLRGPDFDRGSALARPVPAFQVPVYSFQGFPEYTGLFRSDSNVLLTRI